MGDDSYFCNDSEVEPQLGLHFRFAVFQVDDLGHIAQPLCICEIEKIKDLPYGFEED